MIPTILADNAGFDSSELVTRLKAEHYKGNHNAGINIRTGDVGDMEELGVKESFRVKSQIITSATEAAEMLLRIDEVIRAPPRSILSFSLSLSLSLSLCFAVSCFCSRVLIVSCVRFI
jgi:T-complex protein 1 subunit beta